MTSSLFMPLTTQTLAWPNRMVMAPMTRSRAADDGTPTARMVEYYALRAEAGLIISEATSISAAGKGWANAPGIYTDAHEEGWKPIVRAVHGAGGRMFLQLWHMGRVSHPDFHGGTPPVGPSAIQAKGEAHTPSGLKPYVLPHALTTGEIAATVHDYADAAGRAIRAGFDGVEIHAANGYLIDQFLRSSANHRTDLYGGSSDKRLRFLREVTEAVTQAVGPSRVGVRLSPKNPYNSMEDDDPKTTFSLAAKLLNRFGLAYLHVLESLPGAAHHSGGERITPFIRKHFTGTLIVNSGYDQQKGEQAITSGQADAVAYGVPFLANPDLVARFKTGAPLNTPRPETFYTGGDEGYLDYPLRGKEAA